MNGLQDPFEQAFKRALDGKRGPETTTTPTNKGMITTEEEWRRFIRCLEEDGLLTDEDVINDIWQELSKDSKLFQPEGTSRLRLTFPRWQEMLLDRLPPDITAPELGLIRVDQQVCLMTCWLDDDSIVSLSRLFVGHHSTGNRSLTWCRVLVQINVLEEMLRDWDLENLSQEEMRNLLVIISSIESKMSSVGEKLTRMNVEDCYGMMMDRMWRLLCTPSLDEALANRRPGSVNNPFRWQYNHIDEIEKACRKRRPRRIRFHETR